MLSKHIEGHDFKGSLMSGSKNYEGCGTVVVSSQPVRGRNAPTVPRRKTREPVLGYRSAEVVADMSLVIEKFSGHHCANRMTALVLGA